MELGTVAGKMRGALALLLIALALAGDVSAKSNGTTGPLVGRIGERGFLQVESPSFAGLTLAQKRIAYHLTRAAIQLDPIFYDQMSDYGLTAKRLLGALVEKPERLPANVRPSIVEYATLFFANDGNHNETTGEKFVPRFTWKDLAIAASAARAKGARLGTAARLSKILKQLDAPLFDPKYQSQITVHEAHDGGDILSASANNYYCGVSLADLEHFAEKNALNSRLVKEDGKLVEEVWRAGTPDGKVPPGRYARELKAANDELLAAASFADPEQAKVFRALMKYFQTGDLQDWHDFNVLWIDNDPTVDFASGFIEVYRDTRGQKGSAQMVVAVVNEKLQPLMKKLAQNAMYFETKAPWDDRFRKTDVKPPVGKAIETLVATGDFHVSTIGENLPNEQNIREKYGTKSLLLTSSINALNETRGAKSAVEFAPNADEEQLYAKYGTTADNLHTALHEIVGHGSGKVVVPNDPSTYLREFYSTLEEARADLVAYWNIYDPKLTELGITDLTEVGHELYHQVARMGMTPLKNYPTGDTAQEDHDRARLLVANYIIATGAFERVTQNGKSYIAVKDYAKAREAVGKLLAEIMRVKAEGDYEGGMTLVTKYGTTFDPKLRDEVIPRYKALGIPIYWSGVYADLALVKDKTGRVKDVSISYSSDLLKQQLEWAQENGTIGF